MGLCRSLLMLVLLAAALLSGFPSVLFAGGSRENPVLTTETVSQGFLVEEDIFFLLQYRLWQRRGRFWFVMPIELPSRELLHKVYLYRYNRVALRLEQLATVAQEVPPQSNVRSTKFRLEEEGAAAPQGSTRIIFAWQTGWESEQGLLYDLRAWDPRAGTLTDLVGQRLTAEPLPGEGAPPTRYGGDSPEMQRYFGDYRSPWTDNPGIISITELRAILGEHPGELEWGLPRAQ